MQETLIMIVVMAIPKYIYVHEKVHERLKGQGLCTPGSKLDVYMCMFLCAVEILKQRDYELYYVVERCIHKTSGM